jgi:hypothetical protein
MHEVHPELARLIARAPQIVAPMGGFLKNREIRFLALLGGTRLAEGEVLEIGSFQGKSTVVLAMAAKWAGDRRIFAVDPLESEFVSDHARQQGFRTPRELFDHNIGQAGLLDFVDFHQMYSYELGETWNSPLRVLWIDGDHSYRSALRDFQTFSPFLADGAIIAFHDTINYFEGSLRVFMENVLLSRHFGPAGLNGTIAWARYFADSARTRRHQSKKLGLYRRLSRLVPYLAFDNVPHGWSRFAFRFHRWRVPHAEVSPKKWIRQVA